MFEQNFLKLTETIRFTKEIKNKIKWVIQKHEFSYPFFQSVSYSNVIVTKQMYFSPTFLKSWVHTSDNIARAVGGLEYY